MGLVKIFLTILLLLCSSCATWHHTAIDISKQPYHIGDNNCLHKAKQYKALEGGEIWVARKNGGHHAVVKLDNGYWVDPTDGTWSKPLKGATALYRWEE